MSLAWNGMLPSYPHPLSLKEILSGNLTVDGGGHSPTIGGGTVRCRWGAESDLLLVGVRPILRHKLVQLFGVVIGGFG